MKHSNWFQYQISSNDEKYLLGGKNIFAENFVRIKSQIVSMVTVNTNFKT